MTEKNQKASHELELCKNLVLLVIQKLSSEVEGFDEAWKVSGLQVDDLAKIVKPREPERCIGLMELGALTARGRNAPGWFMGNVATVASTALALLVDRTSSDADDGDDAALDGGVDVGCLKDYPAGVLARLQEECVETVLEIYTGLVINATIERRRQPTGTLYAVFVDGKQALTTFSPRNDADPVEALEALYIAGSLDAVHEATVSDQSVYIAGLTFQAILYASAKAFMRGAAFDATVKEKATCETPSQVH